MTDPRSELPSYPSGSTAVFSVTDTFPKSKGSNGLLRSANGDVFFVQEISAGFDSGGGIMVSILVPVATSSFAVERSFASGYLVLADTATGAMYFATRVVTAKV